MSSSLSKRKLDDYADDAVLPINPIRMRKDQTALPSSSNSPPSPRPLSARPESSVADSSRSPTRLQFFVRILSDHSQVLHADSSDTIKSIHEKIQTVTGIPIIEQRLIYRGKQLQWEQTLAECKVQNDAGLHLVGRMRSTGHPQAWQLINDVVSLIFHLCKNNPPASVFLAVPTPKTVKSMLVEFLSMTPRTDADQASGHLQIFSASAVPAALVMLYISSHKPNKTAADEAIRQFISSSKTVLPKHTYHQCVPIILEFCTLLKMATGTDDPLYSLCRSSLGAMVEYVEVGEKKGLIGVRDIFPFVNELAAKLSRDLVLSTETIPFLGPSLSDINDFSSFVVPVRNEIKGDVGFCGPIQVPLSEDLRGLPLCYADEIIILHGIFVDLLSKLERCLEKFENHMNSVLKQDIDTLCVGSCHYLAILKELNNISKLYNGCEGLFWETMKRRKGAFCYLIVRCAKRSEDHNWILECKEVTNFEARRHLAMMMLPEVKDEYGELHEMLIDRSHLLAESFEYIARADAESLRAGLFMEFKNEEATGPGVLREWFFLVCQAIFNPQNALFVACPNDRRRFFPNPASKVDPLHLEYFGFSGKVIALALMHKIQVGIVFDRVFFLQLAGHTITLEDIRDADPYLYSSCKQILEMDPEAIDEDALGLTFIHEIEELGTRKVVELSPGGRSIAVNSKNRRKYVDSLIQQRFVVAIAEQVAHFAQGFADIMSCRRLQRSFFQCLEPEDLDWMLHGSESGISVDDWKAHTEYHGFKETDAQISWFWKIVGEMTAEQKKILLFFWTSIKYLPVEGFSGLASRLYIYKTSEPCDRLPSSHTCFYRLCFPAYPTSGVMHDRLSIITQEHVGCSFGTW
ncbi:ubiquitin protein ligase 5 [Perilla frutescens var. frutescens]|nr:ubiquitin protein ligase 5 [Perilla frutescens var. frutescens]